MDLPLAVHTLEAKTRAFDDATQAQRASNAAAAPSAAAPPAPNLDVDNLDLTGSCSAMGDRPLLSAASR